MGHRLAGADRGRARPGESIHDSWGCDVATIDHETAIGHYCSACGAACEGRFCSACGYENTLADIPVTNGSARRFEPSGGRAAVAPAASPAPADPPRSGHLRVGLLIGGGLAGLAAVAAAAALLLSGGGAPQGGSYRHQLTEAFAPLVTANQSLSRSLTSLDGSKTSVRSASRAAGQAQSVLDGARGAVTVLQVPAADGALSRQVQQALTEENGYLQAVSSTLTSPAGPSAAQLQTLSTGAQSALVAISGVAPGAGSSLSGADNLQSWAHGAQGAQTAARAKAQRKQAAKAAAGSSTATPAAPSTPAPSTGGASATGSVDCGGGLTAGPHTSCSFAENVQEAWDNAPAGTTDITAYSPVTDQTYTEDCEPNGTGTMCTGVGADNSIWW